MYNTIDILLIYVVLNNVKIASSIKFPYIDKKVEIDFFFFGGAALRGQIATKIWD